MKLIFVIVQYQLPVDDIVTFAHSAKTAGIDLMICNRLEFGMMLEPLDENFISLNDDVENMQFLALEALRDGLPGLLHSPFVEISFPPKDKLGLDEVYFINLQRRFDRRERMEACFDLLGINVTWITVENQK